MAIYRDQTGTIEETAKEKFYKDILNGLSSSPKYLSSKYFYDAEGDRLFRQIMQLPEYYLTRSEQEIFITQTKALAAAIEKRFRAFDIIELGPGDATKSTHLLQLLTSYGIRFTYYPIDISSNVIQLLETEMPQRIPGLKVEGLHGDYIQMMEKAYEVSARRKLVLFLGSNIGNFSPKEAGEFLWLLNDHLDAGDLLLIGFDLKKHPATILSAYNDQAGITKAFNLNLLWRINRELGADFDLPAFDHYPTYDPVSGACKSFLISLQPQEVHIGETTIPFERNEPVWTELSQKYSELDIQQLALETGFTMVDVFYDGKHWFMDALWQKI
jgi:L-histidine Nalpha-methyltransferase